MSNIKPCPFCGGNGCISVRNLYSVQVYQAKCTSCTAGIDQMFNTESDAIDAWNKRVDDTQKGIRGLQRLKNILQQLRVRICGYTERVGAEHESGDTSNG